MENFEQLVQQYEPMIHQIIHRLGIYKNKDEYFQIALIALWQAAAKFDSNKGTFTSYAYSYIKGYLQTEMTKSNKHEDRFVCIGEENLELFPDLTQDSTQSLEVLEGYCDVLSPKEKKWYIYTVIYGLKIQEIAKLETVSLSAVKLWRQGARKKLRSVLSFHH